MTTKAVTADKLNSLVEFDSPFTVNDDGSVTVNESSVYAPDLLDDEIESDKWEFWSHGYTGQYGYNGPMMHNSEYLGGRMARDLLSEPGTYVIVGGMYSCNDECGGEDNSDDCQDGNDHWEGWAVLKLITD